MSYMRFNYRSDALGRFVDISIVYPAENYCYYDASADPGYHLIPGQEPKAVYRPGMKFQTIYLIHGGGDDDTLTYRYTNAERYALENNVMLVTPNITNSFGADTNYGVKYATFLGEELPVVIRHSSRRHQSGKITLSWGMPWAGMLPWPVLSCIRNGIIPV